MDRKQIASDLRAEELESLLVGGIHPQLDPLRVSHRHVRKVLGPLENPEGGVARVFLAETADGLQALRVDYKQEAHRSVSVLFHIFLSRAGITPQLHALIEGEELKTLMRTHSALHQIRGPWPEYPDVTPYSASLMNIVENGWNILRTQKPSRTPREIHTWNFNEILNQVTWIQDTLTRLNIQLLDPQFLISKKGEVQLIDLEHCLFIDSQDRFWAYGGVIFDRFKEWVRTKSDIKNDFVGEVRAQLELKKNER